MSTGLIEVLQPAPVDRERSGGLVAARRPTDLRGARIGFLNNGKVAAEELLRLVQQGLVRQCGIRPGYWGRKAIAGVAARPDLLQAFAGCDAVVVAIGD